MVPAHAQTTAPRNAHAALPEVVVSGSRQEQAADELPLSYDVINANTLSNQQSRNLREALEARGWTVGTLPEVVAAR